MADEEKKGGGFFSEFAMIIVGFVLLIILWFANGGPQRADLRGVFLNPPPPVGQGGAYGPQFGSPSSATQGPGVPGY
jgi:hypothetical protein